MFEASVLPPKTQQALQLENDLLLEQRKIMEMQFERHRQAQVKSMRSMAAEIKRLKDERSRLPSLWHERLLSPIMFIGELVAKILGFIFSLLVYCFYALRPQAFKPKQERAPAKQRLAGEKAQPAEAPAQEITPLMEALHSKAPTEVISDRNENYEAPRLEQPAPSIPHAPYPGARW